LAEKSDGANIRHE
jgi:hypothetical protein